MARCSILVIDDDPDCRDILCEMLAEEGHDCRAAAGGRAGLRELERSPVDLAVIDMLMPEFDGVETIMAVRRGWPNTRIIALSGGVGAMSPEYLLDLAYNLGVDATIGKPVHLDALASAVERVLTVVSGPREGARSQPRC